MPLPERHVTDPSDRRSPPRIGQRPAVMGELTLALLPLVAVSTSAMWLLMLTPAYLLIVLGLHALLGLLLV